MYSSGTTGKPKGVMHTTGGYLVGTSATHHYIFDIKPDTVYWCAADIGWITGHSYIVYGPLCNQTTSVLYEGTPDYPDKDRWWAIVERYRVDVLYTSPTAIRTHATTLKPGCATKPFPGIEAAVYDDRGRRASAGGAGYLVVKTPYPAMLRGLFGDPERFRKTYWERFPGVYFTGDGARVDEDGDFWLLGRVDDVMNVSGHRISTIEVEPALVDQPDVAEAAVGGRSDPEKGQAIVAYVTLKGGGEGSVAMIGELRDHVGRKIGKSAAPANIVFTPELPKTRSGKIMRRLLRNIAEHRALGDTTTLAEPAVVAEISRRAREETARGGE